MNKTTAKDVKEVLERYITELKEENDVAKEKVESLEKLFRDVINVCFFADSERKEVKCDKKDLAKAVLSGLARCIKADKNK